MTRLLLALLLIAGPAGARADPIDPHVLYRSPTRTRLLRRATSTEPSLPRALVRARSTASRTVIVTATGPWALCAGGFETTRRHYWDDRRADLLRIDQRADRRIETRTANVAGTCTITLQLHPVPPGTYDVRIAGGRARVVVR